MPSLWKVAGMKDAPNNKVATEKKENKSKKRSKAMVLFSLIWHNPTCTYLILYPFFLSTFLFLAFLVLI